VQAASTLAASQAPNARLSACATNRSLKKKMPDKGGNRA
jgi:hypothetical protein